jgi:HK97 family phage major capsid protein
MMDELEKLLKKFEEAMAKDRADVAVLGTGLETLQKTIADKADADELQAEKVAEMQQAIDTKLGAIEDLKKLVELTQKDINETDPNYSGGFPNARKARDFGLFVMAVSEAGEMSIKAHSALDNHNKALAEAVNSTGGALVPEEFIATLIVLKEKYGVFRRNVRVVPMASDRQTWPQLDGDITVYFPGEGGTITASNPTFKNVTLVAKKGCALVAISSELEEDSAIGIGEVIMDCFARGIAKAEDQIGFLGDGTSTYWGFTGVAGALRAVDATIGNIKSLNVASGNAYNEIVLPDFDDLVGLYPDYADDNRVKWYMHKVFYWSVVRKLLLAYSSNIPTAGVLPEHIAAGAVRTFLGYPVEFSSVMPKVAANSQICATLMNLPMGAYLGERRGVRIDRSREVYFTTDQIGIRATFRIAINAFGVGDTVDPGPIMGLITAAS